MNELTFGTLNRRQLNVRWRAPLTFYDYDDATGPPHFAWRKLLSLRRWLKVAALKRSSSIWCRRFEGRSHRCYCPEGTMIDGWVVVCGFGVWWYYSDYRGKVPCVCDRV